MFWLSENWASLVVGFVLLAVISAVLAKMIRDRKNHKSGCGCGCARSACCGDSPYGTQGNACGYPTYARGQTAQNTRHSFCNPCLLAMLCCLI